MPFQGSIDEVAVYNQVFTDTDVANQDAPAPSTSVDTPVYDLWGNTTTIAGQELTYDAADRHMGTFAPSVANPQSQVTYVRDATDTIVSRSSTVISTITYRAGGSASSGAGTATSVSLPKPAGTAVNDVLLAGLTVASSTASVTAPAGWFLVGSVVNGTVIALR